MPSLVDYEHFSEDQIQNLGAQSSNEWLAWRECQRCARALNDDTVPKLSLMFLAASFRNLFKLNQRAKLLGSTFQKRILTNISNCGVQYHLIYSVDMLSKLVKVSCVLLVLPMKNSRQVILVFWYASFDSDNFPTLRTGPTGLNHTTLRTSEHISNGWEVGCLIISKIASIRNKGVHFVISNIFR